MFLKILLALAAAFALYWTLKSGNTSNKFLVIITMGMTLGIILVLFPMNTIMYTGIGIYCGFVLLAFVYGLTTRYLTTIARIIICLMAASIIAYWLWVFNHWHGNTVLIAIFVLLVGVMGILSKAKLKNELGFLVILATDAVAIILENWMKSH